MFLKNFQEKAIKKLLHRSFDLISDRDKKKLVFKAPTGAGKTLMMAEYISSLCGSDILTKNLSFIWTAPRKLHIQSKRKLENYFSNTNVVECLNFENITDKQLFENQILFLNWESINKKNKNTIIVENEKEFYLNKILENTKEKGRSIILIIDESHHHATSELSKKLIEDINPKLTIEVSATPVINDPDEIVSVSLDEARNEGMIKKSIILNEKFDNLFKSNTFRSKLSKGSDKFVLDIALKKQEEIKKNYKLLKKKINPLLLIQIPDSKIKNENKFLNEIENYLKTKHKITTENGKLAIYLSENKKNLENISKNENETEVIIFKQAIALGWDCPRAQILVLFRDWKQLTFSIQTVGRIMRMPEIKNGYYNKEILNKSYIFTNLENIEIVEDIAKDYITIYTSESKKKINLISSNRIRQRERTRLNPKFIEIFIDQAKKYNLKKKISLGNPKVKISIILEKKIDQIDNPKAHYFGNKSIDIKNTYDLQKLFDYFVLQNLSPYYPEDRSIGRVKQSIYKFFKDIIKLDYEKNFSKIISIVLSQGNINKFIEVINLTKEKYKNYVDLRDQEISEYDWSFPEKIDYSGKYNKFNSKKSIMQPFYFDFKWKTEENFIRTLEKSKKVIWWFKNGEGDQKYFAIPYKKNQDTNLFYIDFIVGFKNKTIGLFDTKSGITIDKAKEKSDGLIKYIEKNKKKKLIGGIITNKDAINFNRDWLVYKDKGINLNSNNLSNWKSLYEVIG